MNMWNVLRMFITYIHRTEESRNTKNTYDFLVQVRNFLLPLSLKVFWRKEREAIFLCWLSQSFYAGFSICTPPTHVAPDTRPRRARESQPSSQPSRTQLNWLFSKSSKSSARAFGAWHHSHLLVKPSLWDFYFDICERHILPACALTPALKFAPN